MAGVLCALFPAAVAVFAVVKLFQFLKRRLRRAIVGAKDAAEERRYEEYVRKHEAGSSRTVTLRRQTHGKHYIKKH